LVGNRPIGKLTRPAAGRSS